MAEIEAFSLTATEIVRRVQAGDLTVRAVADHYAARTERYAKELNTHLYWSRDDVLRQVAEVEARLAKGETLPLAGVPVVVKDNICTRGVPTTCGSKILEGFRPPYDAHVVERLKAAGALIFGKSNCDEFGMGSSNENSAYGPVKNPWDPTRVAGGSSGGSAAAVAAGLAPVALGSDTGGSIRQPAALCGIVGLKPTYGRVSRYGLVAYGSSLDQVGPMARTVADCALVLSVISGKDVRDSTSADLPPTTALPGAEAVSGLKLGLVRELFEGGLDAPSRAALAAAVDVYRRLGVTVREVSLPSLRYAVPAYYVIATAEASANLARFDGVRYGHRSVQPGQTLGSMYCRTRQEGFGREVKQRIMLGTFVLSSGYYDAYYGQALKARQVIRDDCARVFQEVDLLLMPAWPTPAFKLGAKSEDPLALYLSDLCTIPANLAGLPAIAVPCGFSAGEEGQLPIGMQLMGPQFSEDKLVKGAYLYEQASRWHQQSKPGL